MPWNWRQVFLTVFFLLACSSETTRLHKQLLAPDAELRARAAKRLGELKDKTALPLLINLLKDSLPVVRFEAGLALGKIGDPGAIEPLFNAVKRENHEEIAILFTRALGNFGAKALDPLINLTSSPLGVVRKTACQSLGRIGSNKAVDPLVRCLDDRDPQVRKAAILALRKIGDHRGMEAIARKIATPDYTTEQAAEDALSGRGYEESIDQIRSLLNQFNR
ncbi:MAG: HEAT repeat domain-containing protein [bacterium]